MCWYFCITERLLCHAHEQRLENGECMICEKVVFLVGVFPSGLWQECLFHSFVLSEIINAFLNTVGLQKQRETYFDWESERRRVIYDSLLHLGD